MDDIIQTGTNVEEIDHITSLLHHHFRIKNLCNLTYFLDFEVAYNHTSVHIKRSTPLIFYKKLVCLITLLPTHL